MRIVVAMSGGVDSSVAAAELRDAGHDAVGVTLKLRGGESDSTFPSGPPGSTIHPRLRHPVTVRHARSVAKRGSASIASTFRSRPCWRRCRT